MIDPRALKVFLAVCRANSISGGARLLNISQPSVSNTISNLEAVIGAILFERARSGIVLTPEGEVLLRRAEAIDSLLRDAEEEIRLVRDDMLGPLRVGGTPGALVSLLPDAVRRLELRVGRFSLHVIERSDAELIEMLHRGEIELAFVTTGIDEPAEGIEEITLSQDPFALVVGPRNDHMPSEVSLESVAGKQWVLPEARGAFRRQIDALFLGADVPVPREAIRCDSLLATKAIVRSGTRMTILPMKVVSAELSIGVLRAITIREAIFPRNVGVRRIEGGRRSRLAQELLAVLQPKAI